MALRGQSICLTCGSGACRGATKAQCCLYSAPAAIQRRRICLSRSTSGFLAAGGGIYQEDLGVRSDRGFAVATGGGAKISLVGPIRLRVDYRVIKLGSGALSSPTHRVYAGLNLKF